MWAPEEPIFGSSSKFSTNCVHIPQGSAFPHFSCPRQPVWLCYQVRHVAACQFVSTNNDMAIFHRFCNGLRTLLNKAFFLFFHLSLLNISSTCFLSLPPVNPYTAFTQYTESSLGRTSRSLHTPVLVGRLIFSCLTTNEIPRYISCYFCACITMHPTSVTSFFIQEMFYVRIPFHSFYLSFFFHPACRNVSKSLRNLHWTQQIIFPTVLIWFEYRSGSNFRLFTRNLSYPEIIHIWPPRW